MCVERGYCPHGLRAYFVSKVKRAPSRATRRGMVPFFLPFFSPQPRARAGLCRLVLCSRTGPPGWCCAGGAVAVSVCCAVCWRCGAVLCRRCCAVVLLLCCTVLLCCAVYSARHRAQKMVQLYCEVELGPKPDPTSAGCPVLDTHPPPRKMRERPEMATKESHRQRAAQRKRMLAAAVRRAERRGDSADASWARAQYELRTGDVHGTSVGGVA